MKPLQLPEHLVHVATAGREVEIVHGVVLPVAAKRDQLARFAVAQPLKEFAAAVAVAAHQTDSNLHALLVGLSREVEHAPGARPIDGDWLLHEGVHALFDGIGEHRRPKRRRRREQGDVARPQAVEGLLVGLEADEDPVVGHVDPLLELLLDRPLHDLGPVGEHIGERHHTRLAPRHGERVDRRPAPTAAAADDRDANLVAAGSMHPGQREAGERRGSGDLPGSRSEKLTPGGMSRCRGAGHETLQG